MNTVSYCGACGAPVGDGWTHCSACGTATGASTAAATGAGTGMATGASETSWGPSPAQSPYAAPPSTAYQNTPLHGASPAYPTHDPNPRYAGSPAATYAAGPTGPVLPPGPPPSRGRGLLIGLATAVVVLAVAVGVLVWQFTRADEPTTGTDAAGSTTSASAAPNSPGAVASAPAATGHASAAPSSAAPAPASPAAPAGSANLTRVDEAWFMSPSGNIICHLTSGNAQCEIRQRNYTMAKPANCMLEYGDRATLSNGQAGVSCHGDTMGGMANVGTNQTTGQWFRDGVDKVVTTVDYGQPAYALGYGRTLRSGSVDCEMAEDGVRCNDQNTGRGFQLQRGFLNLH